jgi:hypothetical protein
MKRIVKLTERDLSRIVNRVIMEQDPTTGQPGMAPQSTPGNTTSPQSTPGTPNSPQGVKTITPKITIDCSKKLITSSQLPKLDSRESNLAMNQGLIAYYCQAGK